MEAILLPTTSAIIKVLRHFKLGLLEAKRNNLAGISARNATLKRDQLQPKLYHGPKGHFLKFIAKK